MLVLDGSVSPYLPTKEILAAMCGCPERDLPADRLISMLRERLAMLHDVSSERIALFPHDEHRFEPLLERQRDVPWVTYSPGGHSLGSPASLSIERDRRYRIDTAQIEATPRGSVALVMTPNDPTGNAIGVTTAAQLGRRCSLLILDERSAEMQRRSMIPLVEEFDSIVLARSFADWAGLGTDAPGYAITTKRIAKTLDRSGDLANAGLHAALAAVSNAAQLDAIAHRVRLERMRLYRMLRKLNFLAPFPSDSGYVLAQVTRGDRDTIAAALQEREIAVFAPADDRLRETLRFSAISPVATRALQDALVDISRTAID